MCFECMMFGGFHFDPWMGRAEKSAAAQRREDLATNKFTKVRKEVETALFSNTKLIIGLGSCCDDSPLKLLPSVTIEHIIGFVFGNSVAAASASAAPPAGNDVKTKTIDGKYLTDMSIYTPGNKITIQITKPNCHLTQPCWRDFGRMVRAHDGWDVKRVPATEEEKTKFKETRKGNVYFVNAIFTVPGLVKKKRTRGGTKKKKNEDKKLPAKPAKKKAKTSSSSPAKKTKKSTRE